MGLIIIYEASYPRRRKEKQDIIGNFLPTTKVQHITVKSRKNNFDFVNKQIVGRQYFAFSMVTRFMDLLRLHF